MSPPDIPQETTTGMRAGPAQLLLPPAVFTPSLGGVGASASGSRAVGNLCLGDIPHLWQVAEGSWLKVAEQAAKPVGAVHWQRSEQAMSWQLRYRVRDISRREMPRRGLVKGLWSYHLKS